MENHSFFYLGAWSSLVIREAVIIVIANKTNYKLQRNKQAATSPESINQSEYHHKHNLHVIILKLFPDIRSCYSKIKEYITMYLASYMLQIKIRNHKQEERS